MTLRRRSSVPFTAWLSVLCTHCKSNHVSVNAITHTPHQPHYCSACRNMMKEPDNDKE